MNIRSAIILAMIIVNTVSLQSQFSGSVSSTVKFSATIATDFRVKETSPILNIDAFSSNKNVSDQYLELSFSGSSRNSIHFFTSIEKPSGSTITYSLLQQSRQGWEKVSTDKSYSTFENMERHNLNLNENGKAIVRIIPDGYTNDDKSGKKENVIIRIVTYIENF